MKPMKVKDWFTFGEWYDIFWFHSCYISGISITIRKKLDYGLSQVVAEQDGNVQRIFFSRSEWTDIGKRYLGKVIKNPETLHETLSQLRSAADDLMEYSRKLHLTDFTRLHKRQQIRLLGQYHSKHHLLWSLGMVPNVLDLENTVYRDYLKKWLKSKKLSSQKVVKAFQALTTPCELSAAQREERDMLTLAQDPKPGTKLTTHWKKYRWLQFGWTGPSLTLEYFTEVHTGLVKQRDSKDMLRKVLQLDTQLSIDKHTLKKELQMPPLMSKLFDLYEELLFIKAHRMDALFMSYEAIQPLLKKIATDNFLSLSQVYGLYVGWLIKMIHDHSLEANRVNAIVKYSVR
ncbi:MAG: hypothetical protein V1685_07325, partial [Parcubacteria group bacterium]